MQSAEKAVFPPAKGEVGQRRSDPDVDAYVASRSFIPKLSSVMATRSEDGRRVAIGAPRKHLDRFVQVLRRLQREYRPEDLRRRKFVLLSDAGENGGFDERSLFTILYFGVAAVQDGLSTMLQAFADELLYARLARL